MLTTAALPVLLVFSHLRWGFVHQRPQHLLSHLSGRWRVLYFEEPVHTEGEARLEVQQVSPGLTVLVPHSPVAAPGFHDDQVATLQSLLNNHLAREQLQVDVTWLYTPMALPLAQVTDGDCVIYDCMDELSAFKDAPRQLRQRESALLKRADLVFTGGPSLFEAKRDHNPQAYLFPSAVDADHFAPSGLDFNSEEARTAHQLQGGLAAPRLGYFGVIDERLDVALLAFMAQARPEWTFVMAGPVVKIDPAQLPRSANIHWLGMQPYTRLPYLLAGWDLGLLPFALNESTRFISPTKTLEYMAGGKPVVSTAVRDVSVLYGEAVAVAQSHPAFLHACDELLAETGTARAARGRTMQQLVARYSWVRTADKMHLLLKRALKDSKLPSQQPLLATAGHPLLKPAAAIGKPMELPVARPVEALTQGATRATAGAARP